MAVTRMRFRGSGNGQHYIDLAKSMSLQERKLIRQKQIFTVYGGFFVDTPDAADETSRCDINTAPNTWVTRRAVNRGFQMWKKMTAEVLSSNPGLGSGKYSDFKVYLNGSMNSSPLLPMDAANNQLYISAPEWDYSTLTSERAAEDVNGLALPADQFELKIVGPHEGVPQTAAAAAGFTRVGLIQSWVDSRPTLLASPANAPAVITDPMALLFDTGETYDEKLAIIESEGDQPPYDENDMFGIIDSATTGDDNLQRQSCVATSQASPIGPVHGFQALCGLVHIDVVANSVWELVLDVETVGEKF